jgi:hypothetical protein
MHDGTRPGVWFAPLLRKTAHVVPGKPEPLWEFRASIATSGRRSCAFTADGVLTQLFRDGAFVIGLVFQTKAAAVAWAAGERADRVNGVSAER